MELIQEHLDKKNVLVHVFPPMDDRLLREWDWNGAMPVVDHDFLMVVDSSLPGHSNAAVERSWQYRVSLDPGQPMQAQLWLRYFNRGEPKDEVCRQDAWDVYRCYWNYFRVYVSSSASEIEMPPVPLHEGSLKLIWGYPDPDSASIVPRSDVGPARLTELGGYIAVEPGSSMSVPIAYRLPPTMIRSTDPGVFEYRLLVQKQPGMDNDRVSLEVELSEGARLLNTSPEFNSRRGQWVIFDFTLGRDTMVVVSFR